MTDGLNGDRCCSRCGACNINTHDKDCPNRVVQITQGKLKQLIADQKKLHKLESGDTNTPDWGWLDRRYD